MTRLATTVEYHDEETIVSFCSRLATVNGIRSAREFSLHMGFKFQQIVDGDPAAVAELAHLASQDASRLEARALHKLGGSYLLGSERLPKAHLTRNRTRFCPHCLAEDRALGRGFEAARPYGRLIWLVSFIQRCARHDAFLSESATYVPAEDVNDFIKMLQHSNDLDTPAMPMGGIGYQFESFATDRLLLGKRDGSWLDGIQLHVIAKVSEILGAMSMHGRKAPLEGIDRVTSTIARELGFVVLAGGQSSFVEYLKSMQQIIWDQGRYVGGFRLYGRLYSTLRAAKDADFDFMRQLIIDTTIDNLPIGPGDDLFGPVTRRKWHSVQSITKATGFRHSAVKKTLLEIEAISTESLQLRDNSILVPADALEKVVYEYGAHISGTEAQRQLNVGRMLWRVLVSEFYLERKLLGRFSQASVSALYERLVSKTTTAYVQDDDMGDIEAVRKRCGCTFQEILVLLDRGLLDRVMNAPDLNGLRAILVSASEVSEKTKLTAPTELTLRQAEKALEVSTAVLAKLVEGSHIASEIALNPYKRCPQTYISAAAITEFRETYVSSTSVAKRLGLHFNKVRRVLKAAGVMPVLTTDLVNATFYLATDVKAYEHNLVSAEA